ncbi:MAG: hypothetical protein HPY78_03450 [Brevinematales bacterium]|nr:hypothetical protein [Brevinematales bacterium]
MTRLESLRMTDPVLTNVAFDYKFPENAGFSLFPLVSHSFTGGKIPKFSKDAFLLVDSRRGLGAQVKRVSRDVDSVPVTLEEFSLSIAVDDREFIDAADPVKKKLLIETSKTNTLLKQIGLMVEKLQADLATNPDNYASTNKIALSGNSVWSNPASNPIANIETAKEAIRKQIGIRPNTLLLSGKAYNALKTHSALLERIKYSMKGVVTADLIGEIFDIPKVIIGESVYYDGNTMNDIWGNHAILAYVPDNPQTIDEPSFGYTIRNDRYPIVDKVRDEFATSDVIIVRDMLGTAQLSDVAGYLILNAGG